VNKSVEEVGSKNLLEKEWPIETDGHIPDNWGYQIAEEDTILNHKLGNQVGRDPHPIPQ